MDLHHQRKVLEARVHNQESVSFALMTDYNLVLTVT